MKIIFKFIKTFFLLFFLFLHFVFAQNKKFTLSGLIQELENKEIIIGSSVYVKELNQGVSTNAYGFYSLTLPEGTYTFRISALGFINEEKIIVLDKDQKLDIQLKEEAISLKLIEINETTPQLSKTEQMSVTSISMKVFEKTPTFLGERDLIKILQSTPGVSSTKEGFSGLSVRGGGTDQNLMIFDDAVIYNPTHFGGLFSSFYGNIIKNADLYKGAFPAKYGGRLSSVLVINTKDGNKTRYEGEISVGLLSTTGYVEGPIQKNKSSFFISARRTYFDLFTRLYGLASRNRESFGFFFHDFNVKFHFLLGAKDQFSISTYYGQDDFSFNFKESQKNKIDISLNWYNILNSIKWTHIYHPKLFANLSLNTSFYDQRLSAKSLFEFSSQNIYALFDYSSKINDFSLNYDWSFFASPIYSLYFGAIVSYKMFAPYSSTAKISDQQPPKRDVFYTHVSENTFYLENQLQPVFWFKANLGLRGVHYYSDQKNYFTAEPRVNLAFILPYQMSIKTSYTWMNQFTHMLSSNNIGLPSDIWVPSTADFGAETAHQVNLGFVKDFSKIGLSLSLEGYYKDMSNIVGFKDKVGSGLLDQISDNTEENIKKLENWKEKITQGIGRAWGLELMAQKTLGNLTGWVSYTLAYSQNKFEAINNNEWFWAPQDRRHNFNFVLSYQITPKWSVSGNFTLSTGVPLTLPVGRGPGFIFQPENSNVVFSDSDQLFYSQRNQYRQEMYHRLDLGFQYKTPSKSKKIKGYHLVDISVYNVYNQQNPFAYILTNDGQQISIKRVTIFPIIPSVSYTFQFK